LVKGDEEIHVLCDLVQRRNDLFGCDGIVDVGGATQGGDDVTLGQSVHDSGGSPSNFSRFPSSVSIIGLPTKWIRSTPRPSFARCPIASGLVTKRLSESWSVKRRLISSG
jgi:hypothetical protein